LGIKRRLKAGAGAADGGALCDDLKVRLFPDISRNVYSYICKPRDKGSWPTNAKLDNFNMRYWDLQHRLRVPYFESHMIASCELIVTISIKTGKTDFRLFTPFLGPLFSNVAVSQYCHGNQMAIHIMPAY